MKLIGHVPSCMLNKLTLRQALEVDLTTILCQAHLDATVQ